ncbi:MAG: branched-chain amino acid ABC transporter permease [Anaerolineae bacterium]|nr:branched-chain amino acid ABC transporter permease [Anaerolineae bacterium]
MATLTSTFTQHRRTLTRAAAIIVAVLLILWLVPILGGQRSYRLVQSLVTGLLVGGIYALIALGIVIINKASGVFNFAHGWLMLLGGLLFFSFFSTANVSPAAAVGLPLIAGALVFSTNGWRSLVTRRSLIGVGGMTLVGAALLLLPGNDWQFLRAIAGAVIGGVLVGMVVERFAIRPLIGQPLFAMVLMTLAASELLHGVTQLTWGSVEIPLQVFTGLPNLGIPAQIRFGEDLFERAVNIRADLLVAFLLALAAFAVFVAFFQFTSAGLSMRATAENQKLAQSVGLRVRTILAVAWAIATLLATVAGVLQGGASSLSLNMPFLALRAFPAVLLGGLESVGGALVGGIVIGLVQEMSNLLFPGTEAGTELAPYLVLMVVLVIRPDGLFGQKRIERI